ncbi:hypothetical protein NP233_g5772 [Leucocoprinus birnbaumii]|uniref:DUF4140 domain-containing protein n=1 Tax=Leucocoprinus birnbaumii TaxID=56174 RepID=A0AAD5YWD3_9AGAR|nr:hypothetical protein NP233_g5772 [Leucocoprinus birnbaumii]
MTQKPRVISLNASSHGEILSLDLFPGCAAVTRVFPLQLEQGQTQVIITDLPSDLNPKLVDVTYDKESGATANTVTCSRKESTDRDLRDRKILIEEALGRCKHTKASLDKFLGSIDVNTRVDVANLEQTMYSYRNVFDDTTKEERRLDRQLEAVNKEIEELHLKEVPTVLTITTDYGSNNSGKAILTVKYVVTTLSWAVRYILHTWEDEQFPGGWKPAATLKYLLVVINQTGEALNNMQYIRLHTVCVSLDSPLQVPWVSEAETEGQELARVEGSIFRLNTERPITIPSDGKQHELTLAEFGMAASISLCVTPQSDPRSYRRGRFKNQSQWNLLSGVARIFISDRFAGQSQINDVGSGEYFDCSLRIEPGITAVTHDPKADNNVWRAVED